MGIQYGMAFYPKSLNFKPKDSDEFVSKLQADGFIGVPFRSNQQQGFLIGDDFFKLITFLGCSPNIETTPPEQLSDWGNFCYIEIQTFTSPQYFKGLNLPKCSCPNCTSRVAKLLPELSQWCPESQSITCPKCQQNNLIENLNWRHGAGFGQFIIKVNSIFPNEAVPTDRLVHMLDSISDVHWDYFYFELD